jgi:hypothetical protein
MEESENKFILKSILRYLFHLFALVAFALLSLRLYFDFQNFAISAFSTIKYTGAISATSEAFSGLIFFIILCYREDYFIIKRAKLKEYYILPVLASDIICLFITNLAMIIYNNMVYPAMTIADLKSLNNIFIIGLLIIVKDGLIESLLAKRNAQVKPLLAFQATSID